MYGMIKQKVVLGTLGGSSSLILSKSLKWIWTLVPKPRSYMTTGRGELAFGSEFKYAWGINDKILIGAQANSNPKSFLVCREEILFGIQSRRFSSYHESPVEGAFRNNNDLENQSGELYHHLSPPAIEAGSSEGERLWSEATQEGTSEALIPLLSCWAELSEPGMCGLASISTVLNTLEATSNKRMKRPWRFCSEFLLDSCDPLESIKAKGLTCGKLAFLAYSNGAEVEVFRANECSIDDFRRYVMKCSTSTDYYLVAFYDRTHFKQIGGKRFSPIAAYHAGRDLALVMDISRCEYRSFWIPLEILWKAMNTLDGATGYSMGFMVLSRLPSDPCVLYTLSCRDQNWIDTANHLKQLPVLLKSADVNDIGLVLAVVFKSLSANFGEFIKRVSTANQQCSKLLEVERKRIQGLQEQLLRQVQETELYKHVSKWLDSENSYSPTVPSLSGRLTLPEMTANGDFRGAEHSKWGLGPSSRFYSSDLSEHSDSNEQEAGTMVPYVQPCPSVSRTNNGLSADYIALTMLLFALPPHTWSGINDEKLLREFKKLVSIENAPPSLQNEVLSLRQQLQLLMIDLGSYSTPTLS